MTNILGVFGGRRGWLGRADPRSKMALVAAVLVTALLFGSPAVLAGLAAAILASAASSGIAMDGLAARLRPLLAVVLLAGTLRAIFTPGEVVLGPVGPLEITRQGVVQGAALALRILAMALAVAVWAGTTHPSDMVHGLVRLGLPEDWGMALVLSLRMIPRLQDSYGEITRAQRARGLVLQGSWGWERVRRLMPVLVALVIGGLRAAQHWGLALEARGFGAPGGVRGRWRSLEMRAADWLLVGLAFTLVAGGVAVTVLAEAGG